MASIYRYILPPFSAPFFFNVYTHIVVSFVQHQHSTMAVDICVVCAVYRVPEGRGAVHMMH
jgi:hypothetical protein